MRDTHPDDPLLQAVRLSDDELDAIYAMRDGGSPARGGADSLRSRGILGETAFAEPYDAALGPLLAPELVASAHRRTRMDDERRAYFVLGDAGAALGTLPAGDNFVTAFDRAHLPELVARFLGLRAWPGARPVDAFSLVAEGTPSPGALLDLLVRLGAYAFLRVSARDAERRLAWIDAGDGALWAVEPALDPADAAQSSGSAGGATLRATTGVAVVEQLADSVPAWT